MLVPEKERKDPVVPRRILKFGAVGLANTTLSFLLLNVSFYELKQSKIVSNIVATSCALVFSFLLNRNFVFAHKAHWLKQFIPFVVVTAIGTLGIQNAIYILSLSVLKHNALFLTSTLRFSHLRLSVDFVQINGSAAIATLFSMGWNYNGYKRLVFPAPKTVPAPAEEL